MRTVSTILALVLFGSASGAEPAPTFTVTNKIPPAFTVTSRIPASAPPIKYRLFQDTNGQWWQVPETSSAPVREVRQAIPFSETTVATIAPDSFGTVVNTSGVVGSLPTRTSSTPILTLTGHAPIVDLNGLTTMQAPCVGFA